MSYPANDAASPVEQNTGATRHPHDSQDANSMPVSESRLINTWESPAFEEFDLCMEVTAYVQQWE